MKSMKYLCLALASMALFACSNEEEVPGWNSEDTQSVALKLDGLSAGTRAVGDSETDQDGEEVALSNVTIYFTDGTNILMKESLSSSDTEAWAELIGTGHIFHQVPSAVTQIQIVGNAEDKTLTETNVTALKSSVMKAADEQDFEDVTLFGEDTSLENATFTDTEHPDATKKKAEVTLTPLVARFEIGNIACTDVPSGLIEEYDMVAIGLINFNTGITLGTTTASGSMTYDNVLEPGSTADEGEFVFGESGTGYEDVAWAWDKITTATNISNSTAWNPGTNQKFVYQFIPGKVGETTVTSALMPQVKLVLDNIDWADGTANPFNSVVTASFTYGEEKTPLTVFEAGKIYTVDYKFKSGDVGPWNPDDVQCIQINVKVSKWSVVALTPVFE